MNRSEWDKTAQRVAAHSSGHELTSGTGKSGEGDMGNKDLACMAGVVAKSVYRLRLRSRRDAFARLWQVAETCRISDRRRSRLAASGRQYSS